MTQFIILCHARTGSNYLVSMLNQHQDITTHYELFHETHVYFAESATSDAEVIAKREQNPVQFMYNTLQSTCDTTVCGFKHLLFYNQAIIDTVMENDFHLMVLERRNILAQYSSINIAHQTGQWTLKQGDHAVEAERLAWDESDFDAYRQQYSQAYDDIYARFKTRNAPTLRIHYTDLFTLKTIRNTFDFLGVRPGIDIISRPIRKQNTSKITERFSEPDAVKDYLERIGHPEWEAETF